MTSILSFKLNNGNQMIVVGDTQHTYENSTKEESKIELSGHKNLLFCGTGYNRIIWEIYPKINNLRSIKSCSAKILKLKKEKIEEYGRAQTLGGCNLEDVNNCQFMIVDADSLNGALIIFRENNPLKNIELIGSSSERVGEVQTDLQEIYELSYADHTKDKIHEKIIKVFDILGRQDPFTGHPAVFKLEGFVLSKTEPPKKIVLKFNPDIKQLSNYEVKLEDA